MNGRHNQYIGGTRQARERIGQHMMRIKRDVCRDIAFIFKINFTLIQNLYGVAHFLHTLTRWIAKCRVRKQSRARLKSELARKIRRCFCNISEVMRGWKLGDIRVSNK